MKKSDLLKAIQSDDVQRDEGALESVRSMARAMRDLSLEIKELEERIAFKQKHLTQLSMTDLPDLFAQHKIKSLGLDAEGNLPAYDLVAQAYYKAVLPEENDPGLRWLEENGHGDMIKRVYTVKLQRDTQEVAEELRTFLEERDLAFEEKESVPWNTLTAFVKEQIEKRHNTPPLEILGAIVGRVVKMKPKKSE